MSTITATSVPSVSTLIEAFAADAGVARVDLVAAYAAAEKGNKARIRTNVTKAMKDAMRTNQADVAMALLSVESELTTVTEKPEFDVSAALFEKVALFVASLSTVVSDENLDISDDVREALVSHISDIPNLVALPDVSDDAVESLIKVRTGRKSKENDIADLVREAFESVETGTFLKVSDIRARIAANHPEKGVSAGWDGRINAALFVNNDAKGIEGVISVGGPNKVNSDMWRKHGKNGAIRNF